MTDREDVAEHLERVVLLDVAVHGNITIGGLVGQNGADTADSYWDVPTSGTDVGDAETGLGTLGETPPADAMVGDAASSNMTGFDFTDTWATVTGPDDYPVLQAIDEGAQLEARG